MWATEPEVRAAWSANQQSQQVYQAAEMIRQAGFPSGPPAPQGPQAYQQPPQLQQQQAYAPQGGPQYPFPQQMQQPAPPPPPGANYPFPLAPQQQITPPPPVVEHKRGGTQILVGAGLLILGIVITSATHSAAVHNGGGTYVVAYGPIAIGVITIFKGIFNLSMGK